MATPEEQAAAQARNLEKMTGKSLAQWASLVKKSGAQKHGEMVKWLKAEQGLTHGYANLVAHEARKSAASHADDGDLVAVQYAAKQDLRPIYDRILQRVKSFGDDVEVAPKKAYVSLRRARQFAIVQPSTRTRVDVGLKLPDASAGGRLEDSGSFNSMVSHRVRVESVDQIDDELGTWLREAYDAAG